MSLQASIYKACICSVIILNQQTCQTSGNLVIPFINSKFIQPKNAGQNGISVLTPVTKSHSVLSFKRAASLACQAETIQSKPAMFTVQSFELYSFPSVRQKPDLFGKTERQKILYIFPPGNHST